MVATDGHRQARSAATHKEQRGISQDTAFEMLSNQRRRYVLHYLLRENQPSSLRELSKQIAAWENRIPLGEVTYDQRTRVYTALRQAHLPKLADANVISFDRDRGTVDLTDEAEELKVYLHVVPHNEITWSVYYSGLSAISLVLLGGVHVSLFPLDLLSGYGWALLITVLFGVSAAVHVYHERNNRLGTSGDPPI